MPITLPALSRREFFAAAAAGAAACWPPGLRGAEPACDPNRFALLADTHIAGDRKAAARGVTMFDHLQAAGREILAAQPLPAGVLISGDCAYSQGTREDYATLLDALLPMREQGLPVHLALGNHDHRDHFRQAFGETVRQASQLEEKHVLVIPTPHANWFVLDSLDQTNKTPGVLGREQLAWLAEALDGAADKPALVLLHHNPDPRPDASGLVDTAPLFDLLLPRRHVQAWFYGHSHVWTVSQREGLHLVNLPAAAYVFSPAQPSGWVDVRLSATGMTLELRSIDPQHARHGQRLELAWRS